MGEAPGVSVTEEQTDRMMGTDAIRTEVIHEWTSTTSIHGLQYMSDYHYRSWKRILFAILFLTCLGLLGWNLGVIIENYLRFDTTTSSQTIAPTSLDFPDITACNINPFQASRVDATGIVSPKNDEQVDLVSQPLDDFIFWTEFSGEALDNADYWTQTITDNGRCWTFHTNERVSRPGLSNGLFFGVFIDRNEYYQGSDVEGIYIYITEPNSTSTLTVERPVTDLGPGVVHTVFLDVTKFDREEDSPWSTCVKTPTNFNQPACRAECFFDSQIQQCGCRLLGDNRPASLQFDYCEVEFADDDFSICEALPETLDCACPDPPCTETTYDIRSSSLQLSPDLVEFAGTTLFADSTTDEVDAELLDQFVRNNILFVDLNFEQIRQQEVTERKAVTPSGLLAAIGGLLGFFLGISVFSFAEVFDLCFLRLLPRSWGERRLYGVGSIVESGTPSRRTANASTNSVDKQTKSTKSLEKTGTDEVDDGGTGFAVDWTNDALAA